MGKKTFIIIFIFICIIGFKNSLTVSPENNFKLTKKEIINNEHAPRESSKSYNILSVNNVSVKVCENIVRDMEILSYDDYTGKIFNSSFAHSHIVETHTGEGTYLFEDLKDIAPIPFNDGQDGKILSLDRLLATVFYTGINVTETGINHYGEEGFSVHQMLTPTGIVQGRDRADNENTIYPIYICDYGNNRIFRINFVAKPSSSGEQSIFDGNTYEVLNNTLNSPYDISYLKSYDTTDFDDKLWFSELYKDTNGYISCMDLQGNIIKRFSGYKSYDNGVEYFLSINNMTRLSVYSYERFNVLLFIDNKNNNLVSCLLDSSGFGIEEMGAGSSKLIRANDIVHFDNQYSLSSVSIQSTSQLNRDWPNVWLTSGYVSPYFNGISMIHALKVNEMGNIQYLASTSRPLNSDLDFKRLNNLGILNGYSDIYTVENWESNYGIRKYLPFADIHSDTLNNYCYDSTNILKYRAIFTNDCWIKISTQRKNKKNQWENVNIRKLNGNSVNQPTAIKYQRGGWNQSSQDLNVNLELNLPIEDYVFGDSLKINFKLYPEWADESNLSNFPYSVEERTYYVFVQRTCLPKPGGCPFIYVKNEQDNFEPDNNVLHRMEFSSPGMDISDKYKLRVTPKIVDNSFDLYLVENENDSGFIDQVRLYAVDYPFNKKLGITEDNKVVLYDSSLVLSSDSIMLNNTNKTSDLNFHNPSASLTSGSVSDSLYAHFSNLTDKHKKVLYSESRKQSLQTRAISKNSTKLGPNINYPVAFVTNLRNLEYPVVSNKDTAGYLTATSIFSNTVSKIFSRRELESTVILPLFADTDKVDNLKIKWQSNFRVKYLGIANLSYTGYTETEIPMTKGSFITLTNDSNITSVLSSDNSEYGMVHSAGLLKMTYDLSNVPAPGINDVREYVIEVNGYYIKGVNNLVTKPVVNIPQVFYLSQNYPNPFNPITKINYELPRNSNVKIVIYDILGREVTRLVNNELKQAGRYVVEFNGLNYASGVYFYRIEAGDFVQAKKMVLVK